MSCDNNLKLDYDYDDTETSRMCAGSNIKSIPGNNSVSESIPDSNSNSGFSIIIVIAIIVFLFFFFGKTSSQ